MKPNILLDPSARVKTTCITPEGPRANLVGAYDIQAIVSTIYRGDTYKDGPPYTTIILLHSKQEQPTDSWSKDDAELDHQRAIQRALTIVRAH